MRRLPVLPTASSLERALACPASVVLPAVHSSGEDAERGSAIGRFARDVLAGEDWATTLAKVPRDDWRATCRALDFKELCGDLVSIRAEVAYAVDPEAQTGRLLGLNLGRKYPAVEPGVYVGTNDLEGKRDGVEVVDDIKSGREVTSCAVNPQMKFHATARYLVTGASEVVARLRYVRQDGRVFTDAHTFRAFELDTFADSLVELRGRIERAAEEYEAGGALTLSEGRHCTYCPAYSSCPAKTALARAMLPDLRALGPRVEALSSEEAGRAWLMVVEAEKLAGSVREALKGRARLEPLHTRPGKVVREIARGSTEFAQAAAIALLREKGATQAEIDCLFVETDGTQVREVNEFSKRRGRAA